MKKQFILAGLLVGLAATAQYEKRVGINTDKPRATLEVRTVPITDENKNKTKAQGILFPYISEAEKSGWSIWSNTNVTGLVAGTVIWNTTKKCLDYFNGTTWQCTDGSKQNTHPTPWFDVATLELTAGTFEGTYKEGVAFTSANTVKFKLKNNGTEPISNLNLTNVVSVANGTATITATGQNANAVSIPAGQTVEITYTLNGTPQEGTLTATFTYAGQTVPTSTTVAENVSEQWKNAPWMKLSAGVVNAAGTGFVSYDGTGTLPAASQVKYMTWNDAMAAYGTTTTFAGGQYSLPTKDEWATIFPGSAYVNYSSTNTHNNLSETNSLGTFTNDYKSMGGTITYAVRFKGNDDLKSAWKYEYISGKGLKITIVNLKAISQESATINTVSVASFWSGVPSTAKQEIFLPAYGLNSGSINHGSVGCFWSSTEVSSNVAWSVYFYSGGASSNDYLNKAYQFPVFLVRRN